MIEKTVFELLKKEGTDGFEEVNSMVYVMKKLWGRTELKKTEWLDIHRHTANGTFAEAAAYNTKKGNFDLYTPINQVHNYCQWADEELQRKKIDSRWYGAAEEVTSPVLGLGVSKNKLPNLFAGFNNDAIDFLTETNRKLLPINMKNLQTLFDNNGSLDGKTGKELDYHLIDIEQDNVQGYLDDLQKK